LAPVTLLAEDGGSDHSVSALRRASRPQYGHWRWKRRHGARGLGGRQMHDATVPGPPASKVGQRRRTSRPSAAALQLGVDAPTVPEWRGRAAALPVPLSY
jgi:hypothetical protein